MLRKRNAAFTLLELMIIVAILADLIVIAMPSFMRSRQFAQNARFENDLRAATAAFEMYSAETNSYPPNSALGVVPTGMGIYLKGVNWSSMNSVGGRWDWDNNRNGVVAGVAVVLPSSDDLRMTDIDLRLDNGILTTGGFRKMSSGRYTYIIE